MDWLNWYPDRKNENIRMEKILIVSDTHRRNENYFANPKLYANNNSPQSIWSELPNRLSNECYSPEVFEVASGNLTSLPLLSNNWYLI